MAVAPDNPDDWEEVVAMMSMLLRVVGREGMADASCGWLRKCSSWSEGKEEGLALAVLGGCWGDVIGARASIVMGRGRSTGRNGAGVLSLLQPFAGVPGLLAWSMPCITSAKVRTLLPRTAE